MSTVKINKKNCKMIAHRGLSGLETENTASAFVAAGNRSYYGIETDIHKTADGKFAVIHDFDLNRVGGENINVEESSISDIQKVILFDKNGLKSRCDLRVPILENYIDICKKYQKQGILELKSDFNEEEIASIIAIIKERDYLDNITFISFVYSNLEKIRKALPNQSAQFLFEKITDEITEKLIKDKIDVDVHYGALSKESVELFHSNGLLVNCWTVDSKEKAEELVDMGVDFITTNILE